MCPKQGLYGPANLTRQARWPRLAAPRCRPRHPLALPTPARRHSRRTLVGLASDMAACWSRLELARMGELEVIAARPLRGVVTPGWLGSGSGWDHGGGWGSSWPGWASADRQCIHDPQLHTCAGGPRPIQRISLRADVPRQQHVVVLKIFADAFQVLLDGRKLSLKLSRALCRLALRLGRRPHSGRFINTTCAQSLHGVRCKGPGLQLVLKLHSKGHKLGSPHLGWAAGTKMGAGRGGANRDTIRD